MRNKAKAKTKTPAKRVPAKPPVVRTTATRGPRATGIEATLRDFALSYPDTYEEFPWGDRALKIKANKKVFVFMSGTGMSTKLPVSAAEVLDMPYAEPTHYGLGKSGWVSVTYAGAGGERPSLDELKKWIDESFRAIAPKKILAQLP